MIAKAIAAVMLVGANTYLVAQDLAWATWGNPNLRIDGRNAIVGDVNQDGFEDLVAICDGQCSASAGAWAFLRCLSGRDGAVLYTIGAQYPATAGSFRDVAPAGDWNHDGVPDFASMQWAFPPTSVVIHDGATGAALSVIPAYGLDLIADCDVDGDGWNDIVIADNNSSFLGTVTVLSHTGVMRYQLGGTPALRIGNYVAKVGDVDNDGGDDFVVSCNDSTARGACIIVSGRTGAYLQICYGELPGDNMGSFVDAAGDWDGDGYQEFVVAGFGGARSGCVVFSARTGQLMRSWYSTASGSFAEFVAGRGIDYDGDGFPDILAGDSMVAPTGGLPGAVYVLSGRDGSTLHRILSQPTPVGAGRVGLWVNGLRPGPGSHIGTIITPDRQATLTQGTCPNGPIQGVVRAYRGLPRTAELLGPPCAGNLAHAPDLGLQSIGASTIRVHLSDAPPNVPGVLLLGALNQYVWVPTPVALDGLGLPGCSLYGPIDLLALVTTGTSGQNLGYGYLDLPVPVPLTGQGLWWVSAQWLVLGVPATFPGGMTQAMRWRH